MKLKDIVEILEDIAPLEMAEDWDNVGLLAGDMSANIKRIMLAIDMTGDVLKEAKDAKVDLIIPYHPPIWQPLKKIVASVGTSPLIYDAIRSGIAIYSFHTALDAVRGGVNDCLAEIIGIKDSNVLHKVNPETSKMCKLVVFVPESDLTAVSEAVFAVGAGDIGPDGKYSKCSFRARGTGTFMCGKNSKPSIGSPGSFESVEEYRLETIVPISSLKDIIDAMKAAHSYEEVAYDIIPLMVGDSDCGLGRYGELAKPVSVTDMIETIKKKLKVKSVGIISPRRGLVKKAAVCAGSCGSILADVIRNDCDFYLTGELTHHKALELQAAGIMTVCVSHSNSERMILPRIAKRLKSVGRNLDIKLSRKDKDPFTWK